MGYMRDSAGRRLDTFQVQDALASRPTQAADVSTQTSPVNLALKRRAARRELFTLQIPFASLDLSQSPLQAGGSIWTPVPYANTGVGLTVGYTGGALTLGYSANATVTDTIYHLWQARPFATVDLDVTSLTATVYGYAQIEWKSPDGTQRIIIQHRQRPGAAASFNAIAAEYLVNGVVTGTAVNVPMTLTGPYTLRAQMQGRSVAVWLVNGGNTTYIGRLDFGSSVDLRNPTTLAGWTVGIGARGSTDLNLTISGARMYLAGSGHADPRIVSYEDGTPIQSGENVWVCMTTRGVDIPDAYQGVYQLNTATGQLTATGAIFCNRGDGVLRNENAGHLMFDRVAGQWRYLGVGHSDYPGARLVWLGSTSVDLRFGIHTLPVSQVDIPGADGSTLYYEDMYPIYDAAAGKWVASASRLASTSVRLEAPAVTGPWTQTATGPNASETGNLIVKSGSARYVLAGANNSGAGNSFIVRDYDTVASLGNLVVDAAPGGVRVWPCVFPVRTAAGTRWHMLSFDRTSPAGSYSYGRLHYYGQ